MKKKNIIIALVLLLSIGFAAVTTTLVINGNVLFGTNTDNFEVIFTKAIVDDNDLSDTVITDDGKTITYETKELAIVGDESKLDFTVKNNSTQYDAEIEINCIGGANTGTYYEITKTLPTEVEAQEKVEGNVVVTMIKSSVEEITEELTCTLNVTAVERDEEAKYVCEPTTTCNEAGDVCWTDSDCSGTKNISDIVSLGTEENSIEQFYIITSNETNTTMMSMYNLYIGGEYDYDTSTYITYENSTGVQDSSMVGFVKGSTIGRGITPFSSDEQKGTNYSDYSESIVEGYVNNYSNYLTNTLRVENNATLITKEELDNIGCVSTSSICLGAPSWVYSTSYWTRSANSTSSVWYVTSGGSFYYFAYSSTDSFGVRPVVTIDTGLFDDEVNTTVTPLLVVDENENGEADFGDMISIGDERFYVLSQDELNIKMLSEYNLYVGGYYTVTTSLWTEYENPTGVQDSTMLGWQTTGEQFNGVTYFSSNEQKGTNYSDYSESIVEGYVNNYSTYLKNLGVENDATLITKEELESVVGTTLSRSSNLSEIGAPAWLYSTSYWTRTAYDTDEIWGVNQDARFGFLGYNGNDNFGVRPLVTISADLI